MVSILSLSLCYLPVMALQNSKNVPPLFSKPQLSNVTGFLLKLNFFEAFDSVNWSFLDQFGFDSIWGLWIRYCLAAILIAISVMINTPPQGHFGMLYGLQRGDPLSQLVLVSLFFYFFFNLHKSCSAADPAVVVYSLAPKMEFEVQNLIEGCLQLYMDQREVIETLLAQAKIERGFTELVQRTPSCYIADHTRPLISPNNVLHPFDPSRIHNGRSVKHERTHVSNNTGRSERVDISLNRAVSQNSHLKAKQEPNVVGDTLEHDYSYSNHSVFTFGIDSNPSVAPFGNTELHPSNGNSSVALFDTLELRPSIGNISIAPFDNVDSCSDCPSEKLQDGDGSSFGLLGQIPCNFSLSDLTADFSHSLIYSKVTLDLLLYHQIMAVYSTSMGGIVKEKIRYWMTYLRTSISMI